MDKKIVQFKPVRQTKNKENEPLIPLGTIYLDLLISYDGKNLYFRPLYELEAGLEDSLVDELGSMLKYGFSEAIDKLFESYKSNL